MGDKRPSFAHLANKFNTAPPPGYVAGRGRGASSFSKPPEQPPKRGSAAAASSAAASAASSQQEGRSVGAGSSAGGSVEGEVADTRQLDLSETERYEEAELSMDKAEAGHSIEAFSMSDERKEGRFDDDFNFVWKRKGEVRRAPRALPPPRPATLPPPRHATLPPDDDRQHHCTRPRPPPRSQDPDDVHDAWLGEVDAGSESSEKVEKRRKLLQQQREKQQEADEAPPDRAALLRQVAGLLQEGESVAAALRRLSAAKKKVGGGGKRKRPAKSDVGSGEGDDPEAELLLQQFEELTEAADALLRAGRFDIYTERKDALTEAADAAAAKGINSAAAVTAGGADGAAAAAAAAAAGIDSQTHAAAVAGGFVLDPSHRVYWNGASGMYFDPASSLYWAAGSTAYYYWDAASGQYAPAPNPAAATTSATAEETSGAL
jgi:hypothetical protein